MLTPFCSIIARARLQGNWKLLEFKGNCPKISPPYKKRGLDICKQDTHASVRVGLTQISHSCPFTGLILARKWLLLDRQILPYTVDGGDFAMFLVYILYSQFLRAFFWLNGYEIHTFYPSLIMPKNIGEKNVFQPYLNVPFPMDIDKIECGVTSPPLWHWFCETACTAWTFS